MRFLFVAPFGRCQKQTVDRRLLPLAQAVAAAGHEVELLIPAWDCPAADESAERVGGVTLHTPQRGPALHPLLDVLLLRRLHAAARSFSPDVVFVSKPMGYAAAVGLAQLRRAQALVVADLDDLESTAGWGAQRSRLWQRIAMLQEQQLLRGAHGVTAASLALRTYARRQRHFSDDVLYLPNGLWRAAEPAAVAFNPPVALLYTRGNDVDAARLTRLWAAILAQAPRARLQIVGDWAEAPDLPQCQRLGWLQGDALTAALRSAAVAIFPVTETRRSEAKSPARLLDCLAQGLPVVTERIGEYYLLVGGATLSSRCVAEAQDDAELAALTAHLLNAPEARGRLGQQVWQQAAAHTWTQRAQTLWDWVNRLQR